MDRDQVSLTAEGVTSLVELLKSKTDNVVILSGRGCMCLHCRKDSMVMCNHIFVV